jgi:hypothetical protein
MTDEPLTADEFREASNHAIRAVLNLYIEVRSLFAELASALGSEDPALAPITKSLRPRLRKAHYEDRVLPRWIGFVYRPDEGDDDAMLTEEEEEEDESDTEIANVKGNRVVIPWRGSLAYARAILYQPGRLDWEPVLQWGVLTDATVAAAGYPQELGLNVRVPQLRAVLHEVPEQPGAAAKERVVSRLKTAPIKGLSVPASDRNVRLRIPCPPASRPLYSIHGTAEVASVAAELRQLWTKHNGEPGSG